MGTELKIKTNNHWMTIYSILCNKCYNCFCDLEIHLQVVITDE